MKKLYLLPNVITAFGLACGLFVIFKANMVEAGTDIYELMLKSAFLLLLAAFADFADGAVARAFRAESEFGFMFDSLADAISFGVAPSVLLLKSLQLEQGTWLSFLVIMGAMVYSICGVLRLVRFNVKSTEAKGNAEEMAEQKKHFTGLPIPAAAAASVGAIFFLVFLITKQGILIAQTTQALILAGAMMFLGYLMVSRWKFLSLKALHFRLASFHLVFLTVVFAVLILYGALYYFPLALLLFSWSYVLVALTLSCIRVLAGKRSKTLEDFEPDSEEDFE